MVGQRLRVEGDIIYQRQMSIIKSDPKDSINKRHTSLRYSTVCFFQNADLCFGESCSLSTPGLFICQSSTSGCLFRGSLRVLQDLYLCQRTIKILPFLQTDLNVFIKPISLNPFFITFFTLPICLNH